MKTYILNSLPFVFAFFIVTGIIVYLNNQFNNIFQFDFSPKQSSSQLISDSTKVEASDLSLQDKQENPTLSKNVNEEPSDSIGNIINVDSTKKQGETKDVVVKEYKAQLEKKPEVEQEKLEPKFVSNSDNQQTQTQEKKSDSDYNEWLKKVSKILEQIEPPKAAKIIQNYSDNVARDIIYTMNKKNAAKIISELNPEIAQRIIRYD